MERGKEDEASTPDDTRAGLFQGCHQLCSQLMIYVIIAALDLRESTAAKADALGEFSLQA